MSATQAQPAASVWDHPQLPACILNLRAFAAWPLAGGISLGVLRDAPDGIAAEERMRVRMPSTRMQAVGKCGACSLQLRPCNAF